MIKNLLKLFFLCFLFSTTYAQKNPWKGIDYKDIKIDESEIIEYDITIKNASYFQMSKSDVLSSIISAPYREDASNSNVELKIPNSKGDFETYEIFKVKTLSPVLSSNYPDIHSFTGRRSDKNDGSVLRITITPYGFYGMVLKPDVGQVFINPLDKSSDYYTMFLKSSTSDLTQSSCLFHNQSDLIANQTSATENQIYTVDDSNLRTYRIAVAATGEYSQYHINQAGVGGGTTTQQIAAVLAAITVTVDRVNSIYERDLGSTMQLVANNDQIIFLNGNTDPYTNFDVFAMLGENQTTIDNVIQSANYDIGHIVSTAPGGGVAALGSLCVPGAKARGATGGVAPVGDPYDVDYVSHEIGHQFGAQHTFNNFCGGARSDAVAVEPGSGSTIMAYAGICPPNVQSNSDAHFHQISINQIYQNISIGNGSSCAALTGQPNSAPTITPVPDYTIPNGTAFYLDVTATDAENDALTYNWEQINNGIAFPNGQEQTPSPTSTTGPSFRSLPSSSDSRRYFPEFNAVLSGNLAPTWEVIPTVARTMNFAVTVRDNNINVGQSSRDVVIVNFANVGPFQVTSQNTTNINWLPGETRTITWDVAGTDANGINTSNVNILLSTDGGITFNTTLAANTPNDGTEDIVVPTLQAPFCRILVEPVDNVYYAVNQTTFAIDSNVSVNCDNFANNNAVAIPDGAGPNQQGPLVTSVINIPSDINNIDDVNVTLDVSHTYIQDMVFQLASPSGEIVSLWSRNCDNEDSFVITFNDNGAALPSPGTDCGPSPGPGPTGVFAPVDPDDDLLTVFSNGTSGDWTLQFADFFNGDVGTLNSWDIEICSTTFSVEDNQFNEFSISPNPNDGIFNLNFNQPLGNDSTISIFDIRGRLIESIEPNSNNTSLRVELQNEYQRGVYLVEVNNDNGKFVSKLIIR